MPRPLLSDRHRRDAAHEPGELPDGGAAEGGTGGEELGPPAGGGEEGRGS